MTARKARTPPRNRPLKRRVAVRQPRKTLLVFCEGQRTEPEYLHALKRQPFVKDVAAVDLQIEPKHEGAVPLILVSAAVVARRKAESEEAEIDEFWCVFDVEWPVNHPNLNKAIALALSNGIQLAISNPCFEVWLILHFRDQSGWLDTDQACRLRRRLDGTSSKGLGPAKYMDLIGHAASRAAELEARHHRNGTAFPHDNPSSGMHRLFDTIKPVP